MLMEAMRLSMLDHEESQRKEAEEKKRREAAEAAAPGRDPFGDVAGPSSNGTVATLTIPSISFPTSSSPSASSPSPIRRHDKSRSISRSGTPPSANLVLPLGAETQSALRSRTEGSQQLSTFTSATVNGASNLNGVSSQLTVDASSSNADTKNSASMYSGQQSASNHSVEADRSSMYSNAPLPPLPVEAVPSSLSSTSTDDPSTSGSTSTTSSFASLETGTRMSEHGNLGSSRRTSLLNPDIAGVTKPAVMTTSPMHIEDVSQ